MIGRGEGAGTGAGTCATEGGIKPVSRGCSGSRPLERESDPLKHFLSPAYSLCARASERCRYRIEKCGAGLKSEFYDNTDNDHVTTRLEVLSAAMDDVMEYLHQNGEVAILDGTNFTRQRRQLIRDRIAQADGFEILWIESICEDPKVCGRR